MEQLRVTGYGLAQMCRLCLSCDMTKSNIFLFSADLGKNIADIIMECVPVQITRHDKMPTNICRLCFTQLKTFHQFQMQAVRSDRTLQRYLQQMSDCLPQIKVEWALEEISDNSVNQNFKADVTAKCEPFDCGVEFDIFYSKEKESANFSEVNNINEIKDEPTNDNNSLIVAEYADKVEIVSNGDDRDISCEDSKIEIGDTKVGADAPGKIEGFLKYESMSEKVSVKSEETYIPLKEVDSGLCSENIKDVDDLRSNEDNVNRTECPSKFQNFNEKSHDFRMIKSHQCDICQLFFCNSAKLRRHYLIHTREKPYQCDICKMCFRDSSKLKRHNLIHTGEKPYKCDFCKMCFRLTDQLKLHKLQHTGEEPYQCGICKMCFRDSSKLKRHNLIHTGEKPYKCDFCKMCFRLTDQLKLHKLQHTGETPYQCDVCQMCFIHSSKFRRHNLIHTGEKPYQCDICKKCFRESSKLKRHNLIHTGVKPHQCEICNMCFRLADQLKIHKLKHTGEKPYQCDVCKNCFSRSINLKIHKLKHTGEKPYQCDICKKCFRESSKLKRHNLIHTGEKPHQCEICKMCFRLADQLIIHKLKHRGETVPV